MYKQNCLSCMVTRGYVNFTPEKRGCYENIIILAVLEATCVESHLRSKQWSKNGDSMMKINVCITSASLITLLLLFGKCNFARVLKRYCAGTLGCSVSHSILFLRGQMLTQLQEFLGSLSIRAFQHAKSSAIYTFSFRLPKRVRGNF